MSLHLYVVVDFEGAAGAHDNCHDGRMGSRELQCRRAERYAEFGADGSKALRLVDKRRRRRCVVVVGVCDRIDQQPGIEGTADDDRNPPLQRQWKQFVEGGLFENEPQAKGALRVMQALYDVFKDDPMIADGTGGLKELRTEYSVREFNLEFHRRWSDAKPDHADIQSAPRAPHASGWSEVPGVGVLFLRTPDL